MDLKHLMDRLHASKSELNRSAAALIHKAPKFRVEAGGGAVQDMVFDAAARHGLSLFDSGAYPLPAKACVFQADAAPIGVCAVCWHDPASTCAEYSIVCAGYLLERGCLVYPLPAVVTFLPGGDIDTPAFAVRSKGWYANASEALLLGKIVLVFAGLLNASCGVDRSEVQPANKYAERKRRAKGLPQAYFPHTEIRVDPDRLAWRAPLPAGTHASPAPHDRRGHVRRVATGKLVAVSPCKVKGGPPPEAGPANYRIVA